MTTKMSSSFDSLCMLCRDESASDRFIKKLRAGVAPNVSTVDPKYPVLFHCWVEEQVRTFTKRAVHGDEVLQLSHQIICPPVGEEDVHDNLLKVHPTVNKAQNDDLQSLTLGGLKIGVKIKQQKKRMKPNLVNDMPNINAVMGNINSLATQTEDMRAGLKSLCTSTSVNESNQKEGPEEKCKEVHAVNDIVKSSNSEGGLCGGRNCLECAKLENTAAILRVASIYSNLILLQYIPFAKALSMIQLVTSLDPEICSQQAVSVCTVVAAVHTSSNVPKASQAASSSSSAPHYTSNTFLINSNCLKVFLRSLLGQLYPFLASCGPLIAGEVAEASLVRSWVPELSVKIKELVGLNISEHAPFNSFSNTGSANFKLPETFQKPYREYFDSKNEYKTQVTLRGQPAVLFILRILLNLIVFIFLLYFIRRWSYPHIMNASAHSTS
jgi:hypothetical protein